MNTCVNCDGSGARESHCTEHDAIDEHQCETCTCVVCGSTGRVKFSEDEYVCNFCVEWSAWYRTCVFIGQLAVREVRVSI